ncbi:unannotated protein [freshwater metagenome]|uniref:Unannotated protein n=1 Tax=freshwater metagenome TaxID=449393 RepID=A0A6J7IQ78_9ZZZZ
MQKERRSRARLDRVAVVVDDHCVSVERNARERFGNVGIECAGTASTELHGVVRRGRRVGHPPRRRTHLAVGHQGAGVGGPAESLGHTEYAARSARAPFRSFANAFAADVGRDRAKGAMEGPSAPSVRLQSAYGRSRIGRRHDENLAMCGGGRRLRHEDCGSRHEREHDSLWLMALADLLWRSDHPD